jgi:hypothetical protein
MEPWQDLYASSQSDEKLLIAVVCLEPPGDRAIVMTKEGNHLLVTRFEKRWVFGKTYNRVEKKWTYGKTHSHQKRLRTNPSLLDSVCAAFVELGASELSGADTPGCWIDGAWLVIRWRHKLYGNHEAELMMPHRAKDVRVRNVAKLSESLLAKSSLRLRLEALISRLQSEKPRGAMAS